MAPITYTPLERFLLLRTVESDGHASALTSLERASASLKEDAVLRESGFSDVNKLQPEPLKELYLNLIKDQVDLERTGRDGSPGAENNPRKRKIGSPKLESVEDASNYAYLLPSLLDRLYIQYKDEAIKSIEEEERQFRSLQKDIQALELHTNEARAARPGSQGVPPISALLRETEESAQPPRPVDQNLNGTPDSIHPPAGNLHADIYKPLSQPEPVENGPPYLPPPPAPPAQPYPLHSSNIDRRSSNQAPHASASPRTNQAPLPPPERSSASPIILPPPKGMVRSSGSPPVPSPQQSHYPPPRQTPNQHPSQRPQSYYYDNQGSYPPPYSSYGQPPGPIYHPHGGHMQPYMPPVHSPHSGHYPSQPYQPPAAASHHTGYYNSRQYQPNTPQTPYAQTPPLYHDRNVPVQSIPAAQQSARLLPISTTTSSTKWKKYELPPGAPQPASPTRPRSRDISPISVIDGVDTEPDEGTGKEDALDSPSPVQHRHNQQRRGTSEQEQTPRRGRGGRRAVAKPGRHAGRQSAVSPIASGSRGRSQSGAEDASKVKAEPSSAPHGPESESSSSSDEDSRKGVRRRRGTVRNKDADHSSLKRKREDGPQERIETNESGTRTSIGAGLQPRRAPVRPGYILATRNFSRITSSLINQITAHRLGNLFAKPLLEKDAPGYKDRIFRPQDLKSLKAAISSGGRTLNALIEEAGDSAGTGAHMWVPATDELRPPKGIVNAWQLDKELARIFANAVMYNPDVSANRGLGNGFWERWETIKEHQGLNASSSDDGKFEIGVAAPMDGDFVRDTRIVAKDAEEYFTEWRQVEQEEGDAIPVLGEAEDENDEEEPKNSAEHWDNEEGSGRRSKRRKR